MLDIVETLNLSHMLAGSFDWVANGAGEEALGVRALNFDSLVVDYLAAIKRLMPDDANDPAMALVEGHICNHYEINSTMPAARYTATGEQLAPYIEDAEALLSSDAAYEILSIYGKLEE